MFSVEWWPFALVTKNRHHRKKCHQKFCKKNYPSSTVLYKGARYRITEKFQTTGYRLDRKKTHQCYILTKMGCQNPHFTGQQDFQPSSAACQLCWPVVLLQVMPSGHLSATIISTWSLLNHEISLAITTAESNTFMQYISLYFSTLTGY